MTAASAGAEPAESGTKSQASRPHSTPAQQTGNPATATRESSRDSSSVPDAKLAQIPWSGHSAAHDHGDAPRETAPASTAVRPLDLGEDRRNMGSGVSTIAVASFSVGDASAAHVNIDEDAEDDEDDLDDSDGEEASGRRGVRSDESTRKVAPTAVAAARQYNQRKLAKHGPDQNTETDGIDDDGVGEIEDVFRDDEQEDGEGEGESEYGQTSQALWHLSHARALLEACKAGPSELHRFLATASDLRADVLHAVIETILGWPEGNVQDDVLRVLFGYPSTRLEVNDWWLLRHAARFGRARFVRIALQSLNVSPFDKWAIVTSNVHGLCTLTWACINNHLAVVDAILEEAAATPCAKINADLMAAIAVVRQLGNQAIVDRIVRHVQKSPRDVGGGSLSSITTAGYHHPRVGRLC